MNRKQITLPILIFISGFILIPGCSISQKEEDNRPQVQWDGKVVTSVETVSNTRVTCTGDVVIGSGGSMTLDNVLLYMCDYAYGIFVESGK